MSNFVIDLEKQANQFSEKIALTCMGHDITYQALGQMVNKVANGLKAANIQKGDRILLCSPNVPAFPIIYQAVLKIGAIIIPINPLSKKSEIAFYLQDTKAKAFFCFQNMPDLKIADEGYGAFAETETCKQFYLINMDPTDLHAPYELGMPFSSLLMNNAEPSETVSMDSDDTAVILYTSGTTGKPKGAELTHDNITYTSIQFGIVTQRKESDIEIVVLPFFHIFGQIHHMNAGFLAGSRLILVPRFDPNQILELMNTYNVTVFSGVPTMFWALLNKSNISDMDLSNIQSNLRFMISGGDALPLPLHDAVCKTFDTKIYEGYGLTETCAGATFNYIDKPAKPGSIGQPTPGVEMRIVDMKGNDVPTGQPGELLTKSRCVMKGYYKNPEQTEKSLTNGWFHTGDIAKVDEDNYYYIVDRAKDMIIRGGYNVYPREVEKVLLQHPDVLLASVIGINCNEYGEEVKAFIIPNPNSKPSEQEIINWSKEQLSNYKYPRFIEFVKELPMNATGKVQKHRLRKIS